MYRYPVRGGGRGVEMEVVVRVGFGAGIWVEETYRNPFGWDSDLIYVRQNREIHHRTKMHISKVIMDDSDYFYFGGRIELINASDTDCVDEDKHYMCGSQGNWAVFWLQPLGRTFSSLLFPSLSFGLGILEESCRGQGRFINLVPLFFE